MLIAHLPAGYLFTRWLVSMRLPGRTRRACMLWGLSGSIAPDLDMLYFHLVDHGRQHHHAYFTHYPVLWLVLTCLALPACRRGWACAAPGLCFALNGLLHMLLDSVVGDIRWFAPWLDTPFSLATVPALYRPWWLNFILHPSFALELALLAAAIGLHRRDRRRTPGTRAAADHLQMPRTKPPRAVKRQRGVCARVPQASRSQPATTTKKGNTHG